LIFPAGHTFYLVGFRNQVPDFQEGPALIQTGGTSPIALGAVTSNVKMATIGYTSLNGPVVIDYVPHIYSVRSLAGQAFVYDNGVEVGSVASFDSAVVHFTGMAAAAQSAGFGTFAYAFEALGYDWFHSDGEHTGTIRYLANKFSILLP